MVTLNRDDTGLISELRRAFPIIQDKPFNLCTVDGHKNIHVIHQKPWTSQSLWMLTKNQRSAVYILPKKKICDPDDDSEDSESDNNDEDIDGESDDAPEVLDITDGVNDRYHTGGQTASLPLHARGTPTHDTSTTSTSISTSPRHPPDHKCNLQAILTTLSLNVDKESKPPSANNINVLRTDILGSAFRAFRRAKFDPKLKIDVVFVDTCGRGEGAVDNGGPTREFLTLLMKSVLNSRFFMGPSGSKNLALDAVGLARGNYRAIGTIISVCLVHGGVGPHVFSRRLLCQITGQPTPPAEISEIDDEELKAELQKIQQAETVSEIRAAVQEADKHLSLLGATSTVIRTANDRDELLSSSLDYYMNGRLNLPLHQLCDGMEQLGVLQALKDSHDLQRLFVGGPPAPLTSVEVKDLFQVSYSVEGSSRRSAEERAVAYWLDWLIDIEEGEAVLHVDEQEPVKLTLEDVLRFATGAEKIPPLGFNEKPMLDFLHEPVNNQRRVFPEANTCALVLRLPLHAIYDDFSDHMISGIVQAPNFGTA